MKPCFLVLEPNNHVYRVMEEAASRGLEVVVLHTLPLRAEGSYAAGLEAISQRVAVESWADVDAVRAEVSRVLEGRTLAGTYAAHETTLVLDAEVRAQHGLPTLGPRRCAELLSKAGVREALRKTGLTRLRTFDPRQVLAEGRWPLPGRAAFLKPISGAGSVYVTRCADLDTLARAMAAWDAQAVQCRPIMRVHLARGGDLFLEEEAEGELLSVEGYAWDGVYTPLGLTSRTVLERDVAVEMGATFPYLHPHADAIVAHVRRIHQALGFHVGASHTEVVVSPGGEVELVELNIRFAGADVLLLMNLALTDRVESLLVDLACGRRPAPRIAAAPAQRFACLQLVLPPQGTERFESIQYPDGLVREHRLLKPLGTELKSVAHQVDQVAAFIVLGDSYREALDAAQAVRSGLMLNGAPTAGDPNSRVRLR